MKGYSVGALENTKQKVSLPFFQASYLCRLSFFIFIYHLLSSIFLISFTFQVWDEADYVVPPAENGAFFVTTNVLVTSNQTWGACPEVCKYAKYAIDAKCAKYAIYANMQNLQNMFIEPTLSPPPLVLSFAPDCNDFWSRWSFVSWLNIYFHFIYPKTVFIELTFLSM